MLQLFLQDPKRPWQEAYFGCIETLLRSGLPRARSDGFWNNGGQCCGPAGVGESILYDIAFGPSRRDKPSPASAARASEFFLLHYDAYLHDGIPQNHMPDDLRNTGMTHY
jgi:hypothetical protein